MGINKIVYDSTTLIDLTDTTAEASDVASGKYFYGKDGVRTLGTASGGGSATIEALNVTANGTYTAPSGVDGYSPVTVNVSSGGSVASKDVNFIDYDGTILYSYTTAEFNALTELPANPAHSGLTAQGWNWSLANAKAQLLAQPDDGLTIGQMYITASGDTEIDVIFLDDARLSPIMTIAVNGTVTVDWGDRTTADTVTGASLTTRKAVSHTYASIGSYTIVIHVVSGTFTFYGNSSANANYTLLRKNTTATQNYVYANTIQAIRLGSGITTLSTRAFAYCYSLASITIPSGVTSVGTYAFAYCYSLASITIPSNVTIVSANVFQYCTSLANITIPSGVTSIGGSAFYHCTSLVNITIPSGVTSIGGTYTFYQCYSLASITIPSGVTSIGTYTFQQCYSLASITIPSGVTSIGTYTFYQCYSLASITIPSGVTSIDGSAFYQCYGMAEYHLLPTTPPTLAATNAFSGIVSDCVIYVPYSEDHSVLEAYQTANIWSTYASYMQEEPQ
jgi:hypothetical protein